MLIELSITIGSRHASEQGSADILKIIDDSKRQIVSDAIGDLPGGGVGEVMAIVKRRNNQARSVSKDVPTTIRIEDEDGVNDKLIANVASVERDAGRKLQREVLVESE